MSPNPHSFRLNSEQENHLQELVEKVTGEQIVNSESLRLLIERLYERLIINCEPDSERQQMKNRMHMIVLRYPGKCLKCGKPLAPGDWALYGQGIGAICIDCFIQRIGDKALLAKYLKLREYERIIGALKIEAERLAQNVEFGQIVEKIDLLCKTNNEIHSALMDYFKNLATEAERESLEILLKRTDELENLIKAIQDFIMAHTVKHEKKKEPQLHYSQ
jgi:hypothetical protein